MLAQRVLTALVLVALVVGLLFYAPAIWVGLGLGAFWLVGVWEWSRLARLGVPGAAVFIAIFAAAMALVAWTAPIDGLLTILLVVAGIWWLFALVSVIAYPRRLSVPFTVVAGFAALLPAWLILAEIYSIGPRGPALILTLLCIVWSADVGAYFVGRRFGRHKLAPNVSPGKTWEGVGGGLVFAAITGAVSGLVLGVGPLMLVVTAIAAAAGSVLGDLTVSMFKRNCGVKDSSRLLPGHGGVLDRIDSLTSAVAVFAAGIVLAGLIQ